MDERGLLQNRFLKYIMYEAHLTRTTGRVFGWTKAMRFAVGIPLVVSSGSNRSAYELMGTCSMEVEGKRLFFAHPDTRFIEEIILQRCYTSLPDFEIKRDWTIVDCGANIGVFTLYAALQANEGRVFAVEPVSYNCKLMEENVAANGFKNVQIMQFAVADSSGTAVILLSHPGNEAIYKGDAATTDIKQQIVRTVTMHELFESLRTSHVDLLKIDVEGAEFDIFKEIAWLERVKRVVLEVHSSVGDPAWIFDRLQKAGFEVSTKPAYDQGCVYMFGLRKEI